MEKEKYVEFEGQRVWINQDWYESLIEFRTKYITLTNFLLAEAKLGSDGKLSIYTNATDILCALEWHKTQALMDDLHHNERTEKLPF